MLVVGGYNYDGSNVVVLDSAEIFDPATGSFSPTEQMTVPRAGAAAAPLPGGRVLVAGGGPYEPRGAEIFDPATGSFSSTGSLTASTGAAAPLPDGRVLIAGWFARIFDPATGSFSDGTARSAGRSTAAPLPDGRVLLAGGVISDHHGFVTPGYGAELFTPALSFSLKGKKLTVTVAVAGTLTAADTVATKRRKLKPTSARGGPGRITLRLKPTARGKRRLKRKRKLRTTARISFVPAPVRGQCVTLTGPCYSSGYSISEPATLTLKARKRK